MTETTWDASGWVWIGKHTRFANGVFNDRNRRGGNGQLLDPENHLECVGGIFHG